MDTRIYLVVAQKIRSLLCKLQHQLKFMLISANQRQKLRDNILAKVDKQPKMIVIFASFVKREILTFLISIYWIEMLISSPPPRCDKIKTVVKKRFNRRNRLGQNATVSFEKHPKMVVLFTSFVKRKIS